LIVPQVIKKIVYTRKILAIDSGDTSWMLVSTGLVLLMIPALGFFEAGLIRSKNSLSILMQTFSGLAILSTLWFIIGFTLVYAPSQGGIIGGLEWVFFDHHLIASSFANNTIYPVRII